MQAGGGELPWVLVGPTASGKTEVAIELALRHGAEIVSVDSMQLYRGMDVGTAKPTPEQRALVPHHLIDVLDPEEPCNVARFRAMALEILADLGRRGRRPLLVGGSPLYLKGLLWGLVAAPAADERLRRALERAAERRGSAVLHARLSRLDPVAAARIHPNDVLRIVRALEVCLVSGRLASAGGGQFDGPPAVPHAMVGLRWPRAELYGRIDARVDRMVEQGLVDEVRSLRGRLGAQARQAVGYKEFMDYLDGAISLEEAVERVKRNTRRYAKHQLTWFRHFPAATWVDVLGQMTAEQVACACADRLERAA